MKNFLKNQREFLAIMVWACFVFGLIYFVAFSLLNRINETRDKIQEETINRQVASKHLDELPKIKQQYDILQKNSDAIDVFLDKANAVLLIERLEKIADESGSRITIAVQDNAVAIKTAPSTKSKAAVGIIGDLPSTNYLQLKINLNGNYNSVVKFIHALENFEYYSDIVDMDIKKTEQTVSSSDVGVRNPFEQNGKPMTNVPVKNNEDDLAATLDVVFYTK